MKQRLGFVSNSSSASFIVKIGSELISPNIPPVSKDQIKLLEEYGFIKSNFWFPDQVRDIWSIKPVENQDFVSYAYAVVCNEDIVLGFLIENKISFTASCHYDQYIVVYNAEEDEIISLKNFGILYLMNCIPRKNLDYYNKGRRIITREDWLNGKDSYSF